ncbi:MAG: HAMP domain-containing histidine kinase, partial [Chloroflexi bacterium]|nr:HAMP domain-containing histidine kinase [Chloroflexota bacterium]
QRSRAYIFVGILVIAVAIFLYTNSLIRRLEVQAETLSSSIASLCASATYAASEDEELRLVFGKLIETINFPIVITDVRGVPITWKNLPVGFDPYDVTHEEYLRAHPATPDSTRLGQVMALARDIDRINEPIPMTHHPNQPALGYVHYGESSMIREMRYVPALELAAFGIVVLLGFLGFRNAKLAELRSIWIGMARETAHQLGTPISSLMGWVELIRESTRADSDPDALVRMTDEMQRDLERLEKISLRFNQIGSTPRTRRQDVVGVLREALDYLRRRLHGLGRSITIEENYENVPLVDINRELMEWVIENLVKNAAEALGEDGGRIEISARHVPRDGVVEVVIKDSGRGLPPGDRRRVFAPGYSTKRKGWGLGLALSRRIVEEYHKGRLYVAWTEPGKGTAFVISLPAT